MLRGSLNVARKPGAQVIGHAAIGRSVGIE
jgi:hypothetical protein